MRAAVCLFTTFMLLFPLAPGTLAQVTECHEGSFILGHPTDASITKLMKYCVDWRTRIFTGYLPDGDIFTVSVDEVNNLRGPDRDLILLSPPRDLKLSSSATLSSDSPYELLKKKSLDEMTDREFEYFMAERAAELQREAIILETGPVLATARATKTLAGVLVGIAAIGLALGILGYVASK